MRAPASATSSSAMSSAAGCCSTSSTARASTPGAPTSSCAASSRPTAHGLADKPEIVALSKADALDPDTLKEQTARLRRAAKRAPLALSSASGQGVREALRALMRVIEVERTAAEAPQAAEEWRP